ncbi:MAG: SirB2 family protein [Proteobacteria bacterium]|nr:SirB2 family protein [Pseudomonadota bacterium]
MYSMLIFLHVVFAATSIAGFCLRGYWMTAGSALLDRRMTRIAPHIIDTFFLASGIALVVKLGLNPMQHSWLLAKFTGLPVYIVLGAIALRGGRTQRIRVIAMLAAMAVYAYIVGVALSKAPQSWLALVAM